AYRKDRRHAGSAQRQGSDAAPAAQADEPADGAVLDASFASLQDQPERISPADDDRCAGPQREPRTGRDDRGQRDEREPRGRDPAAERPDRDRPRRYQPAAQVAHADRRGTPALRDHAAAEREGGGLP